MNIKKLLEVSLTSLNNQEKFLVPMLRTTLAKLELLDKELAILPLFIVDGNIYYGVEKDNGSTIRVAPSMRPILDASVLDFINESESDEGDMHRAIVTYLMTTVLNISHIKARLIPMNLLSDKTYGIMGLLFIETSMEGVHKFFNDFDTKDFTLLLAGTINGTDITVADIPPRYWQTEAYIRIAKLIYFNDTVNLIEGDVIVTNDEVMLLIKGIVEAVQSDDSLKEVN